MPVIKKPLLACSYNSARAKFPYILTPKVDGIRFVMVGGKALSRSFKPIRNKHIQETLSNCLPDGVDGELTCGDTFQTSTSGIMSITGEPDFKCWIFDYVDPGSNIILPFEDRVGCAAAIPIPLKNYEVLTGHLVHTKQEVDDLESHYLSLGYEGVMLRDPKGTYKFGRSTARENLLLKVKRFVDAEGVLIGLEEKLSNQNEAEEDAFGRTKRSSAKAGLEATGTTGALVVRMDNGAVVKVGTGLNDQQRQEIWDNLELYINLFVKFKYFDIGVKVLPRHPVFLGFRHPDDL